MAGSGVLKLACALFAAAAVVLPVAEAVISCGQVAATIAPCIPYVRSSGGPVPMACCGGVKSLNSAIGATPDRQAACKCLKAAAGSIPGINYGLAEGIPAKCGVPMPFKISLSTNCDRFYLFKFSHIKYSQSHSQPSLDFHMRIQWTLIHLFPTFI
ncbi:hypothetical protein SAY86_028963 [Trapa natans]|uniref:Non-specific lipid-transfer protein n=1 Tax=Trapa natans TaxID=22666 RepID=A0AAN7RB93_TRANT|nr:hypothetical protein SAY86_028963 [Trapa natans]